MLMLRCGNGNQNRYPYSRGLLLDARNLSIGIAYARSWHQLSRVGIVRGCSVEILWSRAPEARAEGYWYWVVAPRECVDALVSWGGL